jgi:hypothetical protein
MASIMATIRDRTDRRYASAPLEWIIADRLNPVLRGWATYFRHGNSSRQFVAIDSYTHQRLAHLASIKHGRPGINWATRFNYQWFSGLGTYRLTGKVRYRAAHA